jgi:L-alanine-DL-glutamate epimerase-like enolase superfamily enzyme
MGQIARLPVHRLLGGAHRTTLDLAEAIGIQNPEHTVAEARRLVALGFRTLKLKIGVEPDRDTAAVRAVRQAVGDGVRIRIDANQGYTSQTAIRVLRRIIDCDLEYVEQPVPAWDLEGLASIRRAVPVRVLADESLHSPRDALELIRRQACDLFGIKLIKTAGLYPARLIAATGEQAGIDTVVISPWESEIGLAAGAHLASALVSARPAQELTPIEGSAVLADFDAQKNRGQLRVPSGPGLGTREVGDRLFSAAP